MSPEHVLVPKSKEVLRKKQRQKTVRTAGPRGQEPTEDLLKAKVGQSEQKISKAQEF